MTKMMLVMLVLSLVMLGSGKGDSVVEQLENNGLPGGLLPSSVKSYSLNKDDGSFWVALDNPCYAHIEDQVPYLHTI